MLEFLTYKKLKKKAIAEDKRVLEPQDEKFLDGLADDEPKEIPLEANAATMEAAAAAERGETSAVAGPISAEEAQAASGNIKLPPSPAPPKQDWKTEVLEKAKSVKLPAFIQSKLDEREERKEKEKEEKKEKDEKEEKEKEKGKGKAGDESTSEDEELTVEEKELQECLEKLNMAAAGGTAFSLSDETKALLKRFTQILKDLANGVPTAYNDLINLFETSSKQIDRLFEQIPGFLKKIIMSVGSTAPPGEKKGSVADIAAKTTALTLPALKDLATKTQLKRTFASIMAFLRTRFPALMGTNALLSLALFVLLFLFYYCWKRGREVRLEKEKADLEKAGAQIEDGTQTDDAQLEPEPEDPINSPLSASATSEADYSNYTLGNASTQTGGTEDAGAQSVPDISQSRTSENSVSSRLPINRPPPPEPAAGFKELAR